MLYSFLVTKNLVFSSFLSVIVSTKYSSMRCVDSFTVLTDPKCIREV